MLGVVSCRSCCFGCVGIRMRLPAACPIPYPCTLPSCGVTDHACRAACVATPLLPITRVGAENVLATDVRTTDTMRLSGPFAYLDVTDRDALQAILVEKGITHVVHLASLLSGEPGVAVPAQSCGGCDVTVLTGFHCSPMHRSGLVD